MEIKVGEPMSPPPNQPSPTPYPTPTNVVLPSFAERGEDVDVDDDGRASFDDKPQRPTPVGGQSIWNLFSPVKEETPAPEKRRDSAMSLATPCVEINQCVGCTRQFFTKSFLSHDAAVLAPSSDEEPASPRHRAGGASMAWRTTRRFSTNVP